MKRCCPRCKKLPKTQTTTKKLVKTISGERQLRVHIKYCEVHGTFNCDGPSVAHKICPSGRTFDTKVLISVGFLRWFFNYQREEIQLLFETRGVHISTGEISYLSEEFLLRFYVIHKRHVLQMKNVFREKGIVLHLDGTAEAGDEITFTAKEGITGITIDSWIMPSERQEYIKPFLAGIRDVFGSPVVVVRDMWSETSESVSEVFPGVPQQICHYHFVRNLGSVIFKYRYERLRQAVLNTKVLAGFLAMQKAKHLGGDQWGGTIVIAQRYWVMLAIEYILYPRERKSGYPFVLPYLEVLHRAFEVKSMLRRIVMWNAAHNFGVHITLDFTGKLRKLVENSDVKTRYHQIMRIWVWFEKVRKVLRVSRDLSGKEQNTIPTSAEDMKTKLKQVLKKIENESCGLDDEFQKASEKIRKICQDHMEELFVKVDDQDGNEMKIVRHNGVEELNHRWSRMHIRRRTGRSRTAKEMTKYGALLAVLSNLENETYVKEVLTDVKDFVYEMQSVTNEEIQDARKLIRKHPHRPLVYSDKKRPELLKKFVEILEDSDGGSEKSIEEWLSMLNSE